MTADHSSDSGRQRTVAELLEQYGADGAGGGRRRRRSGRGADAEPATRAGELPTPDRSAADSAADSAAANAERTWSSLSAVSAEEQAELTRHPDSDDSPWRGYGSGLSGYGQSGGAGTFDNGDGEPSSEWSRPGAEWTRSAADPLSSPTGTGGYPVEGYLPDPDTRAATPLGDSYPADAYPVDSFSLDSYTSGLAKGPTKPPEESTEQLPKYAERLGLGQRPGPVTGPITDPLPLTPPPPARKPPTGAFPTGTGAYPAGGNGAGGRGGTGAFPAGGGRTGAARAVEASGPNTQVNPPVDLFEEDDEEDDDFQPAGAPAAGLRRGGARRGAAAPDGRAGGRAIPDVPAGLDEQDDLEERSGLKAWAILIAQGLGGAIGGAVLWVGFRYLWLNLPVVALAAAVVATVGLVFVVRTIRGSEDLQTTMLAVLVGLIVTISPAVLLLAVR